MSESRWINAVRTRDALGALGLTGIRSTDRSTRRSSLAGLLLFAALGADLGQLAA